MPLPSISLTASDHPRLKKLACLSAERGENNATFLLAEIKRANVVSDDARQIQSLVTMGSWVTYWTNRGIRRRTVQLVWPEDLTSDPSQVSVLSSLGAALVGLRTGDQMPYFAAGDMDIIRIENVTRPEPSSGRSGGPPSSVDGPILR
ncbi:GreA/GreB family elongation factor [Bradyrhizobium sp. 160]|nr:GreA/GreB family elongation factor [Bradyrhizobium sp. 160]